jgi:FkbM family methyltransferase
MIVKTKTKIAGARFIYRVLRTIGVAAPPGGLVHIRRSGVHWELDLGQGIDFSIYLLGAFERSTLNTLRELVKPGDTVFDIGANIGAHTLHLAKAVGQEGHVFALEPTAFAFGKLVRNLAFNPELGRRVTAEQVFLVDEAGRKQQREIYASWPLEHDGPRHAKHLGRLESTSGARTETLDGFVARTDVKRLDLIKIDVDGHEYQVLKGARAVLKRFSPVLVMELSPYLHTGEGSSFEDLIALLHACRYSLVDLDSRAPLRLDSAYLNRLIRDGASINVIARC